jgi:flagellar protein FlgJ
MPLATKGTLVPHTARRLITVPLLLIAFGAGVLAAPGAAAAAGVSATVKTGGTLKVRAAPALSARIVGTLRNKQKISVACYVTGPRVRGAVRTTTAWDRLSTGHYVSHGYVRSARAVPRCAAPSAKTPRYVVGTVRRIDGTVNLRTGPSTAAAVAGSVTDGTKLNLVCAVPGETINGDVRVTAQWDRTSTGTYISHAYMYSGPLPACPDPVPVPVPQTPAQFIASSVPGAQQGWREYGVPPSVTIAQAILESGWGRSSLSTTDNNYFGIKCQNGSYGTIANGCHVYRTQECTKAGTCFDTTASFRTYASRAHSFRDHGRFLKVNSRYAGAFVYARDANKFIWKVWKAGYATDPNYYTKITGLMRAYDLYRYDTWK